MNSFFKTFLAALLAFVVANLFIGIFVVLIVAGLAASFKPTQTTVAANSVLRIDFSEPILDNPASNPLEAIDFMSLTVQNRLALWDVLTAIERAANDPTIDGIYLNLNPYMHVGMASMNEIRDAVIKFKESGKFVISFADQYSQRSYYFSSVADKIYMNPEGDLSWKGIAMNTLFFKGTLEKLGIEPEVIRHGEFKAAVEPFILDKMSPENRQQLTVLVSGIWNHIVANIATARGIESADLQRYATELAITGGQSALDAKMVDQLLYADDVDKLICEMTNTDMDKKPKFVSLSDYIKQPIKMNRLSKNRIAVIYAEGEIVDGKGAQGQIGSATVSAKLADIRRDENVKAVVFRVNSGGGSALASETIWREVELLRASKPVVVSMGDYAASGGYYISSPADAIVSSPYTITGSIGVFGLMFNAEKSLRDKLGITTDVVKTNPSADLGRTVFGFAGVRPMTQFEKDVLQKQVERVYNTFVSRVAQGRNMTTQEVDKIAEGRVWSGINATEIGLVDGMGGLKEAVALAADRAGIADDYRVVTSANRPDSFTQILQMLTGAEVNVLQGDVGQLVEEYQHLLNMLTQPGVQAVMPYKVHLE